METTFVSSPLTRAVVVETKQMVVVLAVTEVNEDVVVQDFSWKKFGSQTRKDVFNFVCEFVYINKMEQSITQLLPMDILIDVILLYLFEY